MRAFLRGLVLAWEGRRELLFGMERSVVADSGRSTILWMMWPGQAMVFRCYEG
jgi:hypothetical protein